MQWDIVYTIVPAWYMVLAASVLALIEWSQVFGWLPNGQDRFAHAASALAYMTIAIAYVGLAYLPDPAFWRPAARGGFALLLTIQLLQSQVVSWVLVKFSAIWQSQSPS